MSHNLEVVAGKVQHVYVGDEPWHGLGKRVHHDLTPAQMMKEAGLDWSVAKGPLSVDAYDKKTKKTSRVKFPKWRGLYRVSDDPEKNGTPLTIVGRGWEPIQNEEFVNFFHDFVMAGDMEMHTAGAICDPNTGDFYTWMLAKIKSNVFEAVKDDVIESFMLFSNPFIYGKKADIRQTNTRVVCNNTLDVALYSHSKASIKVGHRQKFDAEAVKRALNVNSESMQKYKDAAKFLVSKRAKPESVMDYFRTLHPASGKKGEKGELSSISSMFADALEKQPGAEFGRGTWWQAFNATTYAYDHMVGSKNYDEELDERANRLVKSWYGHGRSGKVKSLELALDYAKAA